MFWQRRAAVENIPGQFKEEEMVYVVNKITDYVKEKIYNLISLTQIFYNLAYLGRMKNEVVVQISHELKSYPELFTVSIALELLQGASMNKGAVSYPIYPLIDFIQVHLEPMLKDISVFEKTKIFKYLSALETNLNPPRFRFHKTLFRIKDDLLENFSEMNE